MEEDEYRSTYHSVNQIRCIYEKGLNSRRMSCSHMRRFFLADREGVGCQTEMALKRCEHFLDTVRNKARFTLQLTTVAGPLPHNKEIKVQVGGLQGLQALVDRAAAEVPNAFEVLNLAERQYGSVEDFPFSEIMPAIAQAKGRQRRSRRAQD